MSEQTLVQNAALDPLRLSTKDLVSRVRKRLGRVAGSAYTQSKRAIKEKISLPSSSSAFIESLTDMARQQVYSRIHRTDSLEEIGRVVARSNEVLASASTFLMLFPDSIVLDRTKLTVTRRHIFSEDVMSIRVEDILNVSVTTGPLFGSLTIATRVMSTDDHFMIGQLWRSDATHLKHMIQGYVIVKHNNIQIDHLSYLGLIKVITELGHDKNFR